MLTGTETSIPPPPHACALHQGGRKTLVTHLSYFKLHQQIPSLSNNTPIQVLRLGQFYSYCPKNIPVLHLHLRYEFIYRRKPWCHPGGLVLFGHIQFPRTATLEYDRKQYHFHYPDATLPWPSNSQTSFYSPTSEMWGKSSFQILPVKMEAWVNTLCLLAQPQKELQLNLKSNNTQNCQKIELYGIPTTKDLKNSHSSRWAGRMETQGQTER